MNSGKSMTLRVCYGLLLVCMMNQVSFAAELDHRAQIEAGYGMNGDRRGHLQLSLQKHLPYRPTWRAFALDLYAEGTLGVWKVYEPGTPEPDMLYTAGVALAYSLAKMNAKPLAPRLEAGTGFRHFSETMLGKRPVSTHFQFMYYVGLAWRFGDQQRYETGVRFNHISNANIEEPNPGMDFLTLKFTRAF